jgi:biotin carboxylase
MRKLFIIGASDFQLPAILEAKDMGLYVGVADFNPNAVGIPYADEYYNVSTIDSDGIYEAAKLFQADGIITLCTDMPMRALANSCERLKLIGPDMATAVTATDKGVMIRAFEKNGVEHPKYIVVDKDTDIDNLCETINYPAITKPTDNSGSRGIMLANNASELKTALTYSSQNGREGTVIVEEYMVGPEFSVEVMVFNGEAYILQVTDKLTTGAPHFVEIGHSQPSRFPKDDVDAIKNLARRAALAVGIKNGPAHAEIILTASGPKMVEIGARMGGGCITTHLVPLSTGISMTKATIQTALGEKPDIEQKFEMGSAIRFIIPPVGRVISISGKEEAEKIPGIKLVEIQCRVGQVLAELENGTCRIGYVIAQGNTAEDAIDICERALKVINIEVC